MIFIILCQAMRVPELAKSKTILVMKLTAVLLLAGFLQVSAAGFSQTVTLSKEKIPLQKLFRELKKQTGYTFFYNARLMQMAHPVTITVKNASLKEVLDQVFANQPITYSIINKTIVVSERTEQLQTPGLKDTIPEVRITGIVIDEATKAVIEGASVIIKGTRKGVSTDGVGKFSLGVEPGHVIEISFVGYESKVWRIKEAATITIPLVLKADKTPMAELVVTGYQQIRKESFTGNAVTVTGEELKKVNPQNILKSIQVFDPSFQVAENILAGSNPNRLPNINVRGSSSLPAGDGEALNRNNLAGNVNLPTFILDGFEVSLQKVYDLDPNRIQSVTLLKDAAATAVYGSRAANGVLVITTKPPQEGKLQLSYNYELNVTTPDLTGYDLLNASEKLEYEQLAGLYEAVGSVTKDEQDRRYYQKYRNVIGGVNTYWLSQPLTTAVGHKHSLFAEGGSSAVRYGIELRYHTMPGVMKGSARDRASLGAHLTYSPNSTFLFKNVLTISQVKAKESPYGSFIDYGRMNPYYPKTDSSGRIIQAVDSWLKDTRRSGSAQYVTDNVRNPMYNGTLSSFDKTEYIEIIDAFSADWNITKALRLRSLLSLTKLKSNTDVFRSPLSNEFYDYPANRLNERGSYYFAGSDNTTFDGNLTLNYNKQIAGHFINLAAGTNVRTFKTDYKSFTAIGFTNDRFTNIGFANQYQTNGSPGGNVVQERLWGSFLSTNYSYRNKFLADLSVRADGSSKFGTEDKVATFWSLGIGWNIHREDFMINSMISQLKLRASTGETGSVSFPPYMSKTIYNYYSSNWYSTGVGAVVYNYGNESLQWQVTRHYDIGMDLGLFRDRLFISPRYYYKLTNDLLASIILPPSTGFSTYMENLGDMENTGVELNIRCQVVKRKDWMITLTANMARNENKIVKISNALKAYNDKADDTQQQDDYKATPLLRFKEGQSLNAIYAVRSLGIDPENGKEIFVKQDGTLTYIWDVKDIVPVGSSTPTAYGFFGANITWKKFNLNTVFYTRFGGSEYNQTLVDKVENADPRYNVDKRVLTERWKKPGDHALYKNIADLGTSNASERFVQKDNLLELQSVNLTYDVDKSFYRKLAMNNLRLSFTMNDVWRWSSMKIERGLEYPFARSFTFSILTGF
jgi:TonB-linked SusC/RagA family outer membrane protein